MEPIVVVGYAIAFMAICLGVSLLFYVIAPLILLAIFAWAVAKKPESAKAFLDSSKELEDELL